MTAVLAWLLWMALIFDSAEHPFITVLAFAVFLSACA